MSKFFEIIRCFSVKFNKDKITLYGAYTSYYTVISFIPFLILILMLAGELFDITKGDIANFTAGNIPENIYDLVLYLIEDIMKQDSVSMLSFPIVTLLWSSSRAIMALTKGLDGIFDVRITHGVIKRNIISLYHTLFLITSVVLSLTVSVFGNLLKSNSIRFLRPFLSIIILTLLLAGAYAFFPSKKQSYKKQLFGALFTAIGWTTFSFFFSVYVDRFSNKSYVYGGLSTLIVLMLWIYFCTVIFFIGAEINTVIFKENENIDTKSSS
ncbi:MAG: YihY/virulence factor BrkB family protein [Clostridia bacterium]|nr:YihY/virulence factor BrkB family protein [Clostridia bacterium]